MAVAQGRGWGVTARSYLSCSSIFEAISLGIRAHGSRVDGDGGPAEGRSVGGMLGIVDCLLTLTLVAYREPS